MENLKALREALNLTQEEVAEKIGIAAQSYGAYERDESEPKIENLKKLADFFHTSIDYLVGYEPEDHIDLMWVINREVAEKAGLKKPDKPGDAEKANLLIEYEKCGVKDRETIRNLLRSLSEKSDNEGESE